MHISSYNHSCELHFCALDYYTQKCTHTCTEQGISQFA